MPAILRKDEASDLPFVDFDEHKEVEFVTGLVPRHRPRKPKTTTNLSPSPTANTRPSPQDSSTQGSFTMASKEMRIPNQGTAGDKLNKDEAPDEKELSRRRTAYYDEVFALRESNNSGREQVKRGSMVIADVRTNVIVHDEYTFTTELSHSMATAYYRPESSILVTITHSACLLLGGSFDPAYILTITALPSQISPKDNPGKVSTLQGMLGDSLGVPSSRGVVKFMQLSEDNFAFDGMTYSTLTEVIERQRAYDMASLKRALSRPSLKTEYKDLKPEHKKLSMRNMKNQKVGKGDASASGALPPPNIPLPAIPQEKSAADKKPQKMSKRKSFISGLFGKQSS